MRVIGAIVLALTSCAAIGAEQQGARWSVAESSNFHQLVIANGNAARTAEGIVCRWSVLRNGDPFAAGTFDLKGLAPGRSHVYDMPKAFRVAGLEGGLPSVRVRFFETLADDEERELAMCQVDWPDSADEYRSHSEREIVEGGDAETLELVTDDVVYAFSRKTGLLVGMKRTGLFFDTELLAAPMTLSVPDVSVGCWAESMSPVVRMRDRATFRTTVKAASRDAVLYLTQDWTLFADGALACKSRIRRLDGKPLQPRVGYRFDLAAEDAEVDYFAADPLRARYSAEAAQLSARTAPVRRVRACEVKDGSRQVAFAAVGRPFALAVEAVGETTAVRLVPDVDGDRSRPQQLDFMIGPRRFANVVDIN